MKLLFDRLGDRYFLFTMPCLIAVAVMLVNDHYLKSHFGAGPLGMFTGKLSDFAGAMLLPAWLEIMLGGFLGIRRDRAIAAAIACTFVGLTAIELSPLAIQAYEAANNWVLRGLTHSLDLEVNNAHLTADVTDLIALTILPYVMWGCRRCHRSRNAFETHLRQLQYTEKGTLPFSSRLQSSGLHVKATASKTKVIVIDERD